MMHKAHIPGTSIEWKGTIVSVKIVNIENSFETLLSYLPENVGQTLRCFYDTNSTQISHPTGMKSVIYLSIIQCVSLV